MKTAKELLFAGLAMILVLASCTMEKRVYSSGYHIEWLKKRHTGNNTPGKGGSAAIPREATPGTGKAQTAENHAVVAPETPGISAFTTAVKEHATKPATGKSSAGFIPPVIKTGKEKALAPYSEAKYDRRRLEGIGLAGFIIGVTGLVMPPGIALLMFIIAILFGIISLARINRHPDRLKGRGFAIASLVIGIAGIVALTVLAVMAG